MPQKDALAVGADHFQMEVGFRLSSQVPVSGADVRCVISKVIHEGTEYCVCGDRGNQLHVFRVGADSTFVRCRSFGAHDGGIGCAAVVPPCEWFSEGAIVTGSQDRTLKVWPMELLSLPESVPVTPLAVLTHTDNVCFVTATTDGRIISAAWDATAKIWKGTTDVITLKHEQFAIWGVVPLPHGYATLGADKTLRMWSLTGEMRSRVDEAHDDCIRGGCYVPHQNVMLTIGNDGMMKKWSVDAVSAKPMLSITVSDKYLYSMSFITDDLIAVGSEDRCSYIVSLVANAVVEIAAVTDSVWAVGGLSNGDLVTGCADGTLRIFTQSEERVGSLENQQLYAGTLSSLTFSDPNLQEVNILDLPQIGQLTAEDSGPGRAILIRHGEDKIVCLWSNGYKHWLNIGKVTSTKGAQRAKVYDEHGKEWDFMITVNLEDGRNLPLYLNYDTNQFVAGREFLLKHQLPMYYLDQIANFITRERKPYVVDNQTAAAAPAPAPAPAVQSDVFPMTTRNYVSALATEQVLKKLRTFNDVPEFILDEPQFLVLGSPLCDEWWRIVFNICMKWPLSKSWPILDLLRAMILSENARSIIKSDELITVVRRLSGEPTLDDSPLLVLSRLIGNMFQRYENEARNNIDIQRVCRSMALGFSALTPRTQLSVCNMIMNYSISLADSSKGATELLTTVFDIMNLAMDDESLYRLLYAMGNCITFSGTARGPFRYEPAKQKTDKVAVLITEVCRLLN